MNNLLNIFINLLDNTSNQTDTSSATNFLEELWNSIVSFFTIDNLVDISLKLIISILLIIIAHYLIKFINWSVMKSLSKTKKITKKMIKKGIKPRKAINYSLIYFIQAIIKFLIYLIVFFMILGIFNINFDSFGTILAGAVAGISLSLQDVISSFAYGCIILGAKEYQIGDYIKLQDGPEGTVKRINMLSTVLATLDGQTVYIPNNVIGKAEVYNTSTEPIRRISINFNVPNSTDVEKVRLLTLEVANNDPRTLKDTPPYIVVTGFNDDSVSFSLRVYTKNKDYWDLTFYLNETLLKVYQENNIRIGRGNINIDLNNNEYQRLEQIDKK